ncbi:MAG: Ig-like domain-containing protein, partial [Cytophaga sp.]|uniref:Ig-like domain-containing protein n=1 Tax=Cytophaga sp. TaxID=29535 RepID=UPI003F822359
TTTPTTFCAGGSVTLTANAGYSYKWFNGTAQVGTNSTYTATAAGSYTVEVTNASGCKATSAATTVTVSATPTAVITTTTPTTFCQGGSVVLTASAGSSYKWFNGTAQVGTTSTYTATTAGSYSVEVTNAAGCKATSAATAVTVSATPTAAITTTTPTTFCAGGSVTLTASAGSSYKWFNGTTQVGTTSTYTATIAGSYTVEVTNAGNCSAISSATTVTVNALPNAPTVTTPVTYCQNASATILTATGTGLKWYADNTTTTALAGGAPTPATTTAGTTNYYVSQTTNGCESPRAQIVVTVNALPIATITTTAPTTFCAGGSVTLTADAGSSYKWMNGTSQVGTNSTYTATAAGSYTVEITNASGCKATSAVTVVTVNDLPLAEITASGPTTIPAGGSVTLNANTGPGLTYKWFKGSTQVATAASYAATEAGVYTVEVTNASGCFSTSAGKTININTNQPSVITITSPAANATITEAVDIAVNVTDPDGSVTLVEFLDGNTVIGTSTTAPYVFTWNNPSAGDHVITVRVTDSNGGITVSAPVTVNSTPISTGIAGFNSITANVYPNPANGAVYIDTDTDLSNASFTMVDVLGREVAISSVITGIGAMVDVSNISEGTYVMIIKLNDSIFRKKINVIK